MEALLRDGLPGVCIHPVRSMQAVLELTFPHKNTASQPISLCVTMVSLSEAASEHATILSYQETERTRFLIDFLYANICLINGVISQYFLEVDEILWLICIML